MQTFSPSYATCVIALATALVLAPAAGAQGLSYDITTAGTGAGPHGGAPVSRTFMAGHGQFAAGVSRLDITQSMAPGGMMGAGTYVITNAAKGTTTRVNPATRQYTVLDAAALAKTAAGMQQALGDMVKTEILDVKVGLEDLGAGETMEGYSTLKYRLTESYTMKMTVMGHVTQSTEHGTTELWVAPQLDPLMNPGARPSASAATGPMDELTAQIAKAYATVRKGVVLKSVRTSDMETNGKTRPTTMTMTITNVKRAAISPGVFEVPAGYTKVASLSDALSPMGGIGDSQAAARARAPRKHGSGGEASTAGDPIYRR